MTYEEIKEVWVAKETLEYLISEDCTDCQFDFVDEIKFAIECIEKQIPKKPKIKIYKYPYRYTDVRDDEYDLVCPCCGEDLVEGDHHCKCGQAIDWSEVE